MATYRSLDSLFVLRSGKQNQIRLLYHCTCTAASNLAFIQASAPGAEAAAGLVLSRLACELRRLLPAVRRPRGESHRLTSTLYVEIGHTGIRFISII